MNKDSISFSEWNKINEGIVNSKVNSIAELLTQENELMRVLGWVGETVLPETRFHRMRNWLGRKFVDLGFNIAPDIIDEYRD